MKSFLELHSTSTNTFFILSLSYPITNVKKWRPSHPAQSGQNSPDTRQHLLFLRRPLTNPHQWQHIFCLICMSPSCMSLNIIISTNNLDEGSSSTIKMCLEPFWDSIFVSLVPSNWLLLPRICVKCKCVYRPIQPQTRAVTLTHKNSYGQTGIHPTLSGFSFCLTLLYSTCLLFLHSFNTLSVWLAVLAHDITLCCLPDPKLLPVKNTAQDSILHLQLCISGKASMCVSTISQMVLFQISLCFPLLHSQQVTSHR